MATQALEATGEYQVLDLNGTAAPPARPAATTAQGAVAQAAVAQLAAARSTTRRSLPTAHRDRRSLHASAILGFDVRWSTGACRRRLCRSRWECHRRDASVVSIAGLTVRVASVEHLIAMKKIAGRPQDITDIERLQSKLSGINK